MLRLGSHGMDRLVMPWPGRAWHHDRVDLDALVSAVEAAAALGVDPARVRRWAISYPATMPVRARDRRGRPRYRYGDVVEVEWATRTGRRLAV